VRILAGAFCSICEAQAVMTPSGTSCENGHGGAPLLGDAGEAILSYEPLPDAPEPMGVNPWDLVRELEGKVAVLASQNTQLRASLRKMVRMTFNASNQGTAGWYQEAQRALAREAP